MMRTALLVRLPLIGLLAATLFLSLAPAPLDRVRAARLLALEGAPGRAFLLAQEEQRSGNDSEDLLLLLGQLQLLRGEQEEAEKTLIDLLLRSTQPQRRSSAWAAYGWAQALSDDQPGAERAWQEVPEPQRRALRAELLLRQGHLPQAAAELAAIPPGSLDSGWQAYVDLRQRLLNGALQPDVPTEPHVPRAAGPLVALPLASWPAARVEAHEVALSAALEQRGVSRLIALAQLLLDQGQVGGAVGVLQVIRTEQTILFEATLRQQAGDHEGALTLIRRASAVNPTSAALQRMLALLEPAGPAREQALEAASALDPLAPDLMLVRAALNAAAGQRDTALHYYDQALLLAPEAARPEIHLQIARFALNDTRLVCVRGFEHAFAAAVARPDDLLTQVLYADLTSTCRTPAEVLPIAQAIVERWPAEPAGYQLRGEIKQRLQARDAFIDLLRATDLGPASIWRQRAEPLLIAPAQ